MNRSDRTARRRAPTVPVLALLLIGLFAGGADAADAPDPNLTAVDQWLLPGYRLLAERTAQLNADAQELCDSPGSAPAAKLRVSFARAFAAWQRVQLIRFGPVEFQLRANRFELWPDKRGSVGRHLNRLLASQDPALLADGPFRSGSVAVQGFSALERLLFVDPPLQPIDLATAEGRFRCRVVETISANLATMAAGIVDDWTVGTAAFRDLIATAADGNAFFESRAEVSSKLLNGLHTELQLMVEQKLGQPLGDNLSGARRKRAESWRSGLSLDHIGNNLESCRDLFRVAFAPGLQDPSLEQAIGGQFVAAFEALEQIPGPLSEAVSEPSARPRVEDLRERIGELERAFAGRVPDALGIPLGFNSLDGD